MKARFRSLMAALAVALMMWAMPANAKDIAESDARQLGAYYLSVMTGKPQASDSQISLAYRFASTLTGVPSAYVYNVQGQGFVIVSASDFCYPILGYSDEGLIDTARMAPAFLEYFGSMARRIGYAQEQGVSLFSDTLKIASEWNALRHRTLKPEPSAKASQWLVDAGWDQGSVYSPTYNLFCPSGPDENGYTGYAYVGCVATAMAQIMHYWKYPEHGQGYIGGMFTLNEGESYQQSLGYIDINLNDYTYDWANMPNQCLTYYSSQVQKEACALLCYHCGISVRMQYGFSGSGTQSSYVADALKNKFLYNRADFLRRSRITSYSAGGETFLYDDDTWINMMHGEIDSLRPIYYSGYSMSGSGRDAGGHAFVADGYKQLQPDKFHFNWGWGGQPNTWSDLRTGDLSVPYSYGGYNFYFGQTMTLHIEPKKDAPVCSQITDLSKTDSTATTVTFEWADDQGQTYWRVAYGDADAPDSAWHTVETTVKNYTVQGLEPNRWYALKVQGRCRHTCQYPNGLQAHDTIMWSPWSDTLHFYAGDKAPVEEPEVGISLIDPSMVSLTPNPAHAQAQARAPFAIKNIDIYSTDGRLVRRLAPHNSLEVSIDLSALPPSIYTLRICTEKGLAVKKLVVR